MQVCQEDSRPPGPDGSWTRLLFSLLLLCPPPAVIAVATAKLGVKHLGWRFWLPQVDKKHPKNQPDGGGVGEMSTPGR